VKASQKTVMAALVTQKMVGGWMNLALMMNWAVVSSGGTD
jgi:hypothetical protein